MIRAEEIEKFRLRESPAIIVNGVDGEGHAATLDLLFIQEAHIYNIGSDSIVAIMAAIGLPPTLAQRYFSKKASWMRMLFPA